MDINLKYIKGYKQLSNGRWIKVIGHTQVLCCEVCGSTCNIELHHWAPKVLFDGLFGKDKSEMWPTSYLCRGCHIRWHYTVTPKDRGKRK